MALFPCRRGTAIADTPRSDSTPSPRGNRGSLRKTKITGEYTRECVCVRVYVGSGGVGGGGDYDIIDEHHV